jgi:hypothetical protein
MSRTTTRQSITLVGRASQLALQEFESGATRASFILAIKIRNDEIWMFECEGYGMKVLEQFELMDEGSLVGIIGTPHLRFSRSYPLSRSLIHIDRLEYLGQPLATA